MEKKIYVSYPLGQDWYKVQKINCRPQGENHDHFSLKQYFDWDVVRFASCAGRRFDEVNGAGTTDKVTRPEEQKVEEQIACAYCKKLVTGKKHYSCSVKGFMNYGDTHSLHSCKKYKYKPNEC